MTLKKSPIRGYLRGAIMPDYPWADGKITADEFEELLKNAEQKAAFFDLPDEETAAILKESADDDSDIKKTLDKLTKYLRSSWFRNLALKKAAEYGLSVEEADELARIWKNHKEFLET